MQPYEFSCTSAKPSSSAMRLRSSPKPDVVIAAAPMLERSTVRAACSSRSISRNDSSMNAAR